VGDILAMPQTLAAFGFFVVQQAGQLGQFSDVTIRFPFWDLR
jgi:hypothetical protein